MLFSDEGKLVDKVAKRVLKSLKEPVYYDVFINHRGPDMKNTLASHLYNRLILHKLRVFFDKEELREGDKLTCQIEAAIRTASVHIAIFSPKYAESGWCLNELVQMLESGSTIIPVFSGVNPSHLLCTPDKNGVYAQTLRNLQEKQRYDESDCIKWRKGLSDVAEIDGFQLKAYNGDQGLLLDQVVRLVLRKVRTTPLEVALYPTGLEEKLTDLEMIMSQQQQNRKATLLGIVGDPGVGKSTLARHFFNSHRSDYDLSCFLSKVNESNNLCFLQRKLLRDLTQRNVLIRSIDEGKEKLKRYYSSFNTVIILDNVDRVKQLDALFLPLKDVLNSSSLILVTSRKKDVLRRSGIQDSSIYKLAGLSQQHSKELFCQHAFGQPHPVLGFEEVVCKFLDVSHGLPESLKVFGGLLAGNHSLEDWVEQSRKISPVLPFDIDNRSKSSYDCLDQEEKQILLDIACFFIGKDKDAAVKIWDGYGWKGSLGLQKLQNKNLVEVDSKNCIRMDDHLRNLGRYMAEKERGSRKHKNKWN